MSASILGVLSAHSHSASSSFTAKRLHVLNLREQILSSVDFLTLPRSSLSRSRSGRCFFCSAHALEGAFRPVVYAMLLPVTSEMLLAHWSAAFVPPPQHEPASSAEGLTQACDQSIVALPVDGLRGRWGTQAREALERSLPLSFLPARCTGSRSYVLLLVRQASEAQMVSGALMCLTAFAKQVTPSSLSFSCLLCSSGLFHVLIIAVGYAPLSAVGPLYSTRCGSALFYPLWIRSFLCCVDHPSRVSGPQASLPLRQQSSLPQPKSSGFLSLGSSVTVMFTLFVGFVQVLVGAAALRRCVFDTSCLSFLWRTVRPRTC